MAKCFILLTHPYLHLVKILEPQKEITGKIGSRQEDKENLKAKNEVKEESKEVPTNNFSRRVRQPPGGTSSFIFG